MFDSFGFEDTSAQQISVLFALALGLLFGSLAEWTRFCFRRALVGDDRRAAAGVWLTALATAIIGTQAAVAAGLISFADHRFLSPDLPWLAILLGGALFGGGMVLTRGCISRLTVLSGSGNLRALLVIVVFAIIAHATLKGVLAPFRVWIGSFKLDLGAAAALSALPGGALLWSGALVMMCLIFAARSGNRWTVLAGGALIGLLSSLGWVGTGYVLLDDFDPITMESLSFTAPSADTLFFAIAATSIPAGFGPGLIAGVLLGAALSALIAGRFSWVSFESPRQTGRYLLGAVLMGVGGVLAGGCTVGAGLSGVPTLSFAACLAIVAIALGALAMQRLLTRSVRGSGAPATRPAAQPAE
ncbi:YeeE/YedE family protein [Thalassococcus sp. S3]|uniref:YeeE/YedE family protein n=1 Tax=Thalassococcus sp. S3 TaxID=2017482 RepID=UPI0010249014|nr:YeeE/YedE family protein [Thalassococcus sp. S3]QBF31304.1 YeeE/YedE family protein [Thalassococcus sp. S3]